MHTAWYCISSVHTAHCSLNIETLRFLYAKFVLHQEFNRHKGLTISQVMNNLHIPHHMLETIKQVQAAKLKVDFSETCSV